MKVVLSQLLMEVFLPCYLLVKDTSYKHQGHHGFSGKEGTHFDVVLVTDLFESLSLVQRHRQVNLACSALFDRGIHALSMKLYTVSEWRKLNG